jgi:hypothetical protein
MVVALIIANEESFALQAMFSIQEAVTVKQYQGTTNDDRKPQGVTSAQPHEPAAEKESANRKREGKKTRPDKLTQTAKQGK